MCPSVQHKRATSFQPLNPSFPHQKPLSSTHLPQFHTKNPSVQPRKPLSSTHSFFGSHNHTTLSVSNLACSVERESGQTGAPRFLVFPEFRCPWCYSAHLVNSFVREIVVTVIPYKATEKCVILRD